MRGRRRTWFPAPLIVVTAGCSSSPANKADEISDYDRIYTQGTACVFSETIPCPKNASCNPPPPRAIECPAELGTATSARIGPAPGTAPDSCVLIVPPCTERSCGVPIKCIPTSWARTIEPLAWTITPGEDGRCVATPRPRTNFDGGGPAIPVACAGGVIERANPKAPCVVCGTSPCGLNAQPIACPDVKP